MRHKGRPRGRGRRVPGSRKQFAYREMLQLHGSNCRSVHLFYRVKITFRDRDDLPDAGDGCDEVLTNHFEALPQKIAGRAVVGLGRLGGVSAESADVELQLSASPSVHGAFF